jgi:hypothetical protein
LVELASLADMRAVIRKSSDVGYFEPKQSSAWREGVEGFAELRHYSLKSTTFQFGNPHRQLGSGKNQLYRPPTPPQRLAAIRQEAV